MAGMTDAVKGLTAQLRILVTVTDRATAQMLRLAWLFWWMDWGTNGARRRTALVVLRDL